MNRNSHESKQYIEEIESIIEKHKLCVNHEKTASFDLNEGLKSIRFNKNTSFAINFLGYEIGSIKHKKTEYILSIGMSERKLKKYEDRINVAYENFYNKKAYNRKKLLNEVKKLFMK